MILALLFGIPHTITELNIHIFHGSTQPDPLLQALAQARGVTGFRFHDLRHTAATLMLLNGIPLIVVSRRLGHSKPSVTLDIYGHYIPGMQKEAAAMMDELVTPIAAKWQQIGNSQEGSPEERFDLTAYVAVADSDTPLLSKYYM